MVVDISDRLYMLGISGIHCHVKGVGTLVFVEGLAGLPGFEQCVAQFSNLFGDVQNEVGIAQVMVIVGREIFVRVSVSRRFLCQRRIVRGKDTTCRDDDRCYWRVSLGCWVVFDLSDCMIPRQSILHGMHKTHRSISP